MSGMGVRSGVRADMSGRRARAAEVAVVVALLAGPLVPVALPGVARAGAQTLDLGGVPTGPAIGPKTAAGELATELGVEAQDLVASAQKLSAEAKDAVLAKARLRSAAAYLLAAGAESSWPESACAVAGLRLAGSLRRADEVIEAAASARSARTDAPLAGEDAKAAVAAMRALAQAPIDGLRAAAAARADVRAVRVADALAGFLAPLVAIAEIVEGGRIEDCWPVLADARVAAPERADRPVSTDEARAAIGSVQDANARGALTALLEAAIAAGARASLGDDLGAARSAAEAASWIDGRIAAGAPWSVTESTLRATSARVAADARALAFAIGARDEGAAAGLRASIAATSSRIDAARLVLAMRAEPSQGEQARKRLDAAAEALVAGSPGATERQMRRAAERIAECCEACAAIVGGAAPAAPKDFREIARQIEREARIAIRGVPAALALLAQDPTRLADPDVSAPIERAMQLAADRAKLASMQSWLERVAALRPAAGAGFSSQLRRLARLQLDPIRRGSAQAAVASLELQIEQAIPFAYEDELKRGGERARALTDGRTDELVAAAGAARIAWADALAKGDFGGAAAQRLDRIARLLACLRDLDSLGAPITRGEGDRLATWGGWAARRSVLAPAAQDLDARAVLAVRSLLAPPSRESESSFARDIDALEKALPLVRLAARLERTLGPLMRGSPESLLPTLAPLVDVPGEGAFLAPEWPRLLALNRALFEAEFARRSGNTALARALDGYLADLARDLDRAAFGAAPAVTTLPDFDGSEDATGDDRRRRR